MNLNGIVKLAVGSSIDKRIVVEVAHSLWATSRMSCFDAEQQKYMRNQSIQLLNEHNIHCGV